MSKTKQPEAQRLADALERPGYGWHSTPAQCAAELRRQYAELETLRTGYAAARLEIEGLTAAQESLGVEFEKVLHDNLFDLYEESAPHGQAPAQAAPAYKDSTPELHVGDSAFEGWYSSYNPTHKGDKQRARDAYAAGMGDPLVMAALFAPTVPASPAFVYAGERGADLEGLLDGYDHGTAFYTTPQQAAGKAVHQFRKQYCADWYDGRADHGDSGGPYEERTLYTVPQPTARLDALDAARYRWLREGNDAKHSAAWHVAVNLYGCEWDDAIDAALAAQEGK